LGNTEKYNIFDRSTFFAEMKKYLEEKLPVFQDKSFGMCREILRKVEDCLEAEG